jgi:hypothetical protein
VKRSQVAECCRYRNRLIIFAQINFANVRFWHKADIRSPPEPDLLSVLLFTHVFHPVDGLAVQRFLNGDMCHCRPGRCPMPMLLTGRKPDHVARPDFLDRATPPLHPPETERNDQRLTEWMCMSCGAGTRFERNARCTGTCRFMRFEEWVNANCASEPLCRSLA